MTVTQKDRLEIRNQVLDDYESKLGIPNNTAPGTTEELQSYLNMDRDTIEGISPERAISISTRLSQFSFYIQRCFNRNKSVKRWAEHELDSIVAAEISQYDKYTKHEIKVAQICRQNSAAKELNNIIIYAEQMMDRLEDIASGIRNLSYVISLNIKIKLGDNK